MSARLIIDPRDPRPIWRQIEEGVRRLVATGTLAPGTPAPSVRELARELQVNPATVSKAYQRLTGDGVLEVRRGEGTWVAESPPALSAAERRRSLEEGAVTYATLALTLGATPQEASRALAETWERLTRPSREEPS